MYSGTVKPVRRSAAWRISLWGTLAFACGTMALFLFLLRFVAGDIQRRTDAWLSGEVETLRDVATRTPKDKLYHRVVGEVAELASREIPDKDPASKGRNDSVFFLQTNADGSVALWAGDGNGAPYLKAMRSSRIVDDKPFDLRLKEMPIPFRVAGLAMSDGSHIYLGASERDELHTLHVLQAWFLALGVLNVLLGFAIIFYSTRRMLGDVREITQAASRMGESDLTKRVPTSGWGDEVDELAQTLNRMLGQIETSVHQLRTITNSVAHDLRSPLTAIRAKLEISLTRGATESPEGVEAAIDSAIDEIDRLTEMLTQSLDVAEAQADALRLERRMVDLDEMFRMMIDLYEPCMAEQGLRLHLRSAGAVEVFADAGLLHRMVANLFDNERKHLPVSCTVMISLRAVAGAALLVIEDDGPGFPTELQEHIFKTRVKGFASTGHGLGLAFVEAVVSAHGGAVSATNRAEGGARLTVELPLATAQESVWELAATVVG
jgi:signal transduction histidine kinase